MTKRLFVLLFATVAFCFGLYAVRSKKPVNRPAAAITTNIPALKLNEPVPGPSAPSALTVRTSLRNLDIHLVSRVASLALLAIILSAAAYFGLGKNSETARAYQADPQTPDSIVATVPDIRAAESAIQKTVPQEEITSLLARSAVANIPPPAPTATPEPPAPTPAVAAEVATPPPPPAAAPAAISLPADGIEAIICALPWPCQQAINVAACESGRDMQGRLDGSWATNGNNYGLFQINSIHANKWPDFWDHWMDPTRNAQFAYDIWLAQGWWPWDCRWAAYN